MKKFILALIFVLVATNVYAGWLIRKIPTGPGPGGPFFEANWNGMAEDDELCTAGCPDTWDAISDDNNVGVVNDRLEYAATSNFFSSFLDLIDTINTQTISEYWFEFTVEFSDGLVTSFNDAEYIMLKVNGETLYGNLSTVHFVVPILETEIDRFEVQYNAGSFVATACTADWTATGSTEYLFRGHIKKASASGVEDGIVSVWIEGTSVLCENTGVANFSAWENDTINAIRFGFDPIPGQVDLHPSWLDNFKFYIQDPGWTKAHAKNH